MKCQNPECQKEVPEGKKYCDENCLRRHMELKIPKRSDLNPFWIKGEGSTNRDHNIDQVKKMILSGLSYQDIRRKAIRFFTSRKFEEYYGIASDEIKEGQ